jgi:nucleoside-triphosphatase
MQNPITMDLLNIWGKKVININKNILLTGIPRIGKTTIIHKILDVLNKDCAGFYTEEIKEHTQRVGFNLTTIKGEQCTLAHKNYRSPHRVGKYRVNLDCLDTIGVTALQRGIMGKKIIIIDEIGKMELFSEAFRKAVVEALNAPCPVLGTILLRSHSFCEEIKNRGDVEIIDVTEENRALLPTRILKKITRSEESS